MWPNHRNRQARDEQTEDLEKRDFVVQNLSV